VKAAACAMAAAAWVATAVFATGERAEHAPLAAKALLLDIATAGSRWVAVGDRGIVVLSDDLGRSWHQAESVPTEVLLTSVCFMDARRGIAVGHDETALVTRDAGEHWQQTHHAPQSQQPLLDVWCDAQGRAIAVGAYSVYFESGDAGTSWHESKLAPLGRQSRTPDDLGGDPHLNRIVSASATRFYIAGEAGHLYRSDDGATSWMELPSPYEGSFFGVLPLGADSLLAYGLRGHLFQSDDAGLHWRRIETGTVALLDDAVRLADGRIAVFGLSGTVLVGAGGGESFMLAQQDDRKGLAAALAVAAATVVTAGEGGVKLIGLPRR